MYITTTNAFATTISMTSLRCTNEPLCLEMHLIRAQGVPNFGKDHEVKVNHLVLTMSH